MFLSKFLIADDKGRNPNSFLKLTSKLTSTKDAKQIKDIIWTTVHLQTKKITKMFNHGYLIQHIILIKDSNSFYIHVWLK